MSKRRPHPRAREWFSDARVSAELFGDPNRDALIVALGHPPPGAIDLPGAGRRWVEVERDGDDRVVRIFGWADVDDAAGRAQA